MTKILIADDQAETAQLLVAMLELDGFVAERLEGNWDRLVEEVQRRRPDLVILDVRLPRVSGLDLVRQLRSHPDAQIASVPVLLTSALDHRYDGAKAGADSFLAKPFTRDALLQAIARLQQ